jgi:hypothetical protein
MGTWGVKLYENDDACDARDTWLTALRQGASASEAMAETLKVFGKDDAPLVWVALADTQWTWGRLDARVLKRARKAIAAGGDLELWDDPKDRAARRRMFNRVAARLKQPPPAPKSIRVRNDAVEWKRGQLWAYHTLDDKHVVFRVAAFDPTCGLTGAPVTELLDVVFDKLPPAPSLAEAGVRSARSDYNASGRYDFFPPEHRASPLFEPKVKQRGELPRHRLKRLRAQGEPRPATAETLTVGIPWNTMDEFLSGIFDVGGPRPGAVLAWPLPSGDTAYTMVEFGHWERTLIKPMWQLAVLDCRGDADTSTLEKAGVAKRVTVDGFAPPGLREIAFRPIESAEQIFGAIFRWETLAERLDEKPPYYPAEVNLPELRTLGDDWYERLRGMSYAELAARVDERTVETITGPSGAKYLVEIIVRWEREPGGDVHVYVAWDDARAEKPLFFLAFGGFTMTPKGKVKPRWTRSSTRSDA